MNKEQLVKRVAERAAVSQAVASDVLGAMSYEVAECLRTGEKITVPGVAILTPITKAPRAVRNPKTGESLGLTKAKPGVRFKAAKALSDHIGG